MSWIKFLNKIKNEYDVDKLDYLPRFRRKEFLNLKFNFDSKFEKICFKNTDKNIISLNRNLVNNKQVFEISDPLIDNFNFKKCPFFFILSFDKYEHMICLVIDQNKKQVILYDSLMDNESNFSKIVMKQAIPIIFKNNFKDYKFIKNNYGSKLEEECVPNSLMFAYLNLKYNTDVNKFSEYMNSLTIEDKIMLNLKFLKFLDY